MERRDRTEPGDEEIVVLVREELGWSVAHAVHFAYLTRLSVRVCRRCGRQDAPAALRSRILTALPPREGGPS